MKEEVVMEQKTNSSRWTILGAVGAALAASLCCILPVGAAALGVAGFAASAFFAAWRPYFLGLTFTMLGVAFYLAYRPRTAACEPDSLCERPRFTRSSRVTLWVITVLVMVLAAFPYYSGALVRAFGGEPKAPLTSNISTAYAALRIQGMDCTACAALIEKNLARIRGVRSAKVSFERKVASINYDTRVVAPETFVKAVEKAGYKSTVVKSQGQE
jgi:mercuric ion transport protein